MGRPPFRKSREATVGRHRTRLPLSRPGRELDGSGIGRLPLRRSRGLLGHRRLGEPGVALDAVERAAEDDLRNRAGAVHPNPPSRSAIKPSTETLIE
jgi:hypothetical protein